MSAEIPERYRADPWIDVDCFLDGSREDVNAHVPIIVCREWLSLTPGDAVGFAETGTGFRFGKDVPPTDGQRTVTTSEGQDRPRIRIPREILSRLEASENSTLRIHREQNSARVTNPIPELQNP